jgi:ubiquinone/menaquinone biosynthesis C-methylase UbiE
MSANCTRRNMAVSCSPTAYDSYTANFLGNYDLLMIRRLAAECSSTDTERGLLDIGAGAARLLLKIAAMPRLSRIRITGLELFSEMASQASRTISKAGMQERIQIVQGDAHALPFQSGAFDIVISRSTIHHFAEPVQAFREMHRVLRSSGVAIVHEPRRGPPEEELSRFNRSRAAAGIPVSTQSDKYTAGDICQFVREAGLEIETNLRTPSSGYASIGMELCIRKQ